MCKSQREYKFIDYALKSGQNPCFGTFYSLQMLRTKIIIDPLLILEDIVAVIFIYNQIHKLILK